MEYDLAMRTELSLLRKEIENLRRENTELEMDRAEIDIVLRMALSCIEENVDEVIGSYGKPISKDPRHFHPDEESSTEEEIATHAYAVEQWNAGNEIKTDFGGWFDDPSGIIAHVDKMPWGLGTSRVPTGAKKVKEAIRTILDGAAAKQ